MKSEIKLEIISTYQFRIVSGYQDIKRSYSVYDELKNNDHLWGEHESGEEGTASGPWIDENGFEILKKNEKYFEIIFLPPQYLIEFSEEEIIILNRALEYYMKNACAQYGENSPVTKSIVSRNENFYFFEIMRMTASDLNYLKGCLSLSKEINATELFAKLGKAIKPKIERLYSLSLGKSQ